MLQLCTAAAAAAATAVLLQLQSRAARRGNKQESRASSLVAICVAHKATTPAPCDTGSALEFLLPVLGEVSISVLGLRLAALGMVSLP